MVLASLDSDLYIEARTPDHCGHCVNFVAQTINRNGTERITLSSDADGTRCADGLSWPVAKACSDLRWRLFRSFAILLIFSDDDKYARAAAEKDLIAPAKDLSKSRLSIACVLHAHVPHCST